jgi:hypothetical protein
MSYRVVLPDSAPQAGFSSSDLISINIPIEPGTVISKNSICLSGIETFLVGGAPATVANGIQYDGLSGIHGVFENVVVYINNGQTIENLPYYWRTYHDYIEAKKHWLGRVVSNQATKALQCGVDQYSSYVLTGERFNGTNSGANSFSMEPFICLNRTDSDIDFRHVQNIRIELTLRNVDNIFSNPQALADLSYALTGIQCHYIVKPAPVEVPQPNRFLKVISTKLSVKSSLLNLTYNPPANVIAYSLTFNKVGNPKQWVTDMPPQISRVEFSVGGMDYLYTFPFTTLEEITLNYIRSQNFEMKESNAIYGSLLGFGFGIGVHYMTPIDFRKDWMRVSVESAITESNAYSAYSYYTCVDEFS